MLMNPPATFFAICFYELVLRDGLDKIGLGHAQYEDEEELARHLIEMVMMDKGNQLFSGKIYRRLLRRS
jgi:hypothetical protein